MLRTVFTYFLTALILTLSVQNAVGEIDEALHHETGGQHIVLLDSNDPVDQDHEGDHSQHCCHAHANNISNLKLLSRAMTSKSTHSPYTEHIGSRPAGPPTPPPNT